MVKPKPVTVRSSRPGTGREPVRVTAANPAAASTAKPALARTAVSPNPEGRPTSSPSPVTARTVLAAACRPPGRPVTRAAASTMTGAAPIVISVASGTEVSDTAVK
jgi:mRNA-degrading endonuclease toxin of MazEF toxin-antitoxin module